MNPVNEMTHEPDEEADRHRYWAFISYSHQDERWATWLHKKLERYRIPGRLVGRTTKAGIVPKRIYPVFRDRDELPGSSDLGKKISAALRSSRFLVVLCSPNSAHSHWVNEEVKEFKRLGGEDRVLSFIVDGEPWASDKPESGLLECFPDAVRHGVTTDGELSRERSEPIAADARAGKDGPKNAFIKLLSGLLDVDYDDLKQRDKRRRMWMRVQLAALTTVIIGIVAGIWYDGFIDSRLAERAKNQRFSALLMQKGKTAAENRDSGTALFYGAQAIRYRHLADSSLSPKETDFLSSLALEAMLQQSSVDRSALMAAALSPDATTVVTGDKDGRIAIRRASDLSIVTTLGPQSSGITRIAYAPNDELIVSGDEAGVVTKWTGTAFATASVIGRHGSGVTSLAFSPDGGLLASAGRDGLIAVWNTVTEQQVTTLNRGTKVNDIAFTPDGRRLVSVGDDRWIVVWDFDSGSERHLHRYTEPLRSVTISSDGRYLAAGSWDTSIKIWDLPAEREIAVLTGHGKSVDTVAFDPTGDVLVSGSLDETLKVWDIGAMDEIATLRGHSHYVTQITIGRDGTTLISVSEDQTIKRWRLTPREHATVIRGHSGTVRAVAYHPNGQWLASAGDDQTIRLWEVPSGREIRRFSAGPDGTAHSDGVRAIAFSPDGQLLLSGGRDKRLRIWRVADGALRQSIDNAHQHWIFSVAFSPDNRRIASASYDGDVKVWNVPSLDLSYVIDGHERKPVGGVAFSSDGKLLATASNDNTAKIWTADSGKPLHTLRGHEHVVRGIAFSPDDGLLATTSADQTVRLWNVAQGTLVDTLLGHHALMVWSVSFSSDGVLLASASNSMDRHTVRLWNVETREIIEWLAGHREFAVTTAFSPDTRYLASGGTDGTIRLWRVSDFEPVGAPTNSRRAEADRDSAPLRRFLDDSDTGPDATGRLAATVGRLTNLELIGSDALPIIEPGQVVVP